MFHKISEIYDFSLRTEMLQDHPFAYISLLPPSPNFMNIIVSSENSVMLMRLHCGRFYPILQFNPSRKELPI